MMKLEVGDTLMLELKPDALVTVRCGDVTLPKAAWAGSATASPCASPSRCAPTTTFAMFEKADGSTKRMEAP